MDVRYLSKQKSRIMKNILTTLLILVSLVSFSQTKVQLEVENENGEEQYKLKLEREVDGETVVTEKTYNSKEEMKNDSELKDVKLHFMEGHKSSFKSKDGNILIEIDKDANAGKHQMMFISEDREGESNVEVIIDEDGKRRVIKDGKEVDLDEIHESGENVFIFKGDGDDVKVIEENMEVEVTVDENGTHHVTVNGEEVDYNAWKEGNDQHHGFGKMEWVEESEDGKKIKKEIIIIKEDGEGDNDVKVEAIVDKIMLHLQEVNEEDEKAFSLEDNKELKLDEFNFYPNPSDGTFQLKFQGKDRATMVKVTDINGKQMYAEDLQNFSGTYDNEINLSGLKKGVYLLQVVQGGKAVNKKIVIE